MSNCKIGKVTPKNTGNLHVLPQPDTRFQCHHSATHLRNHIDENTKAVGFFILKKDGSVAIGLSHEGGTALAEMIGATEILKQDISAHWDTPDTPNDEKA